MAVWSINAEHSDAHIRSSSRAAYLERPVIAPDPAMRQANDPWTACGVGHDVADPEQRSKAKELSFSVAALLDRSSACSMSRMPVTDPDRARPIPCQ